MKSIATALAIITTAFSSVHAESPLANLNLKPGRETTLLYTTGSGGDQVIRLRVDKGELKLKISFGGENHVDNEAVVSEGNSIVFECHAVRAIDNGGTGVSAVYQFSDSKKPATPEKTKTAEELSTILKAKEAASAKAADANEIAQALAKGEASTDPKKKSLATFTSEIAARTKAELDAAKTELEAAKAAASNKAGGTSDQSNEITAPFGN